MNKKETDQIQIKDQLMGKKAGDSFSPKNLERTVNSKISRDTTLKMEYSSGDRLAENIKIRDGSSRGKEMRPNAEVLRKLKETPGETKQESTKDIINDLQKPHDIKESKIEPGGRPNADVLRKLKETPNETKKKWTKEIISDLQKTPYETYRNKMQQLEIPEDETVRRHVDNFKDFKKKFSSGKIELEKNKDMVYVSPKDILPPRYQDPQHNELNPKFLYEHGNKPQDYNKILDSESAKQKYTIVMSELSKGKSLDELKQINEYRETIDTWWGENNQINLIKHKESYILDRNGTHRIYFAQKNELDKIPAFVTYAKEKYE